MYFDLTTKNMEAKENVKIAQNGGLDLFEHSFDFHQKNPLHSCQNCKEILSFLLSFKFCSLEDVGVQKHATGCSRVQLITITNP